MEIEYDVVKSVRDLQKQGYQLASIEKNLTEMGYTSKQTQEIIDLATGVDQAELQTKAKKMMLIMALSFILLVILMAMYAIFVT